MTNFWKMTFVVFPLARSVSYHPSLRLNKNLSMMILPFLLCMAAGLSSAFGIQYQDMEFLGMTCPGRDKCENMFSNATQDFRLRNCECDSTCDTFGDCCLDGHSTTPRRYNNPVLKCVGFGTESYIGAFMVVGCPAGADPALKQKCEGGMDLDDPFLSVPVTAHSGPTYPNAYCAACNGAALDRLIRWDLLAECNDLATHNVSSAYIWQNLKRDAQGWGVEYMGDVYDVKFVFNRSADARRVRLCRRGQGLTEDSGLVFGSELVSECPGGYRRDRIREACASYTAVVYKQSQAYRNPHCALCHGVKMRDLVCDPSGWLIGRRKEFSFAHLFDVSGEGDVGRRADTCTKDQKYDPVSKTCRNLVCAIPGYVRRNNRCVKL